MIFCQHQAENVSPVSVVKIASEISYQLKIKDKALNYELSAFRSWLVVNCTLYVREVLPTEEEFSLEMILCQ